MAPQPSLLEELRVQYEASRKSHERQADVPGFQEIDARTRGAFRWLEKAVAYLDELGRRSCIDSNLVTGWRSGRRNILLMHGAQRPVRARPISEHATQARMRIGFPPARRTS